MIPSAPLPRESFPKDQIKVLLLENIHPSAVELLRAEGFSRIRHATAAVHDELGFEPLGLALARTEQHAVDASRSVEAELVDTRARAEIIRLGRRIANLEIRAWQEDEARPIALARMNFLLERDQ